MGVTIIVLVLLAIALIVVAYHSGHKDGDLAGYKRGTDDGFANGRIALVREQAAAKAKLDSQTPAAAPAGTTPKHVTVKGNRRQR